MIPNLTFLFASLAQGILHGAAQGGMRADLDEILNWLHANLELP